MLLLIADENFNNAIVRGLLRVKPNLDIVRVQDVGLFSADDLAVLEWAAQQDRILLTHDVSTITKYADERAASGKYMPGVIEVNRSVPLGVAIDDILLITETFESGDLQDQIIYLPIR